MTEESNQKKNNVLKKGFLGCLGLILLVIIIVSCASVFGNDEETKQVEQENIEAPKSDTEEEIDQPSWQDEVKRISTLDKTETEKFDEVMMFATSYKASKDELKEFEVYIVDEYKNKKYLSDIKNHEYMLTNVLKSAVVEKNYNDQEQKPIDNFAFDFLQNTKYTYRGVDTVDSESVKSNEEQMNKALSEVK